MPTEQQMNATGGVGWRVMDDDILKQILLNQRQILNGIICLLTPRCKGSARDANGETVCNYNLINRLHETDELIGKRFNA